MPFLNLYSLFTCNYNYSCTVIRRTLPSTVERTLDQGYRKSAFHILQALSVGESCAGQSVLFLSLGFLICTKGGWYLPFFFLNKFLKFIYLFIYLFLAVLGLRFCARAFSSCGKRGPLFIAVHGPFTVAASLVVAHRLQTHRLSSCGSRA